MRERVPWPVQDSAGGLIPRHPMFLTQGDEEGVPMYEEPSAKLGISVFISHSSKDADLALALIELLKAGLGLLSNQIRCSSVDGYRLPVGVNTEGKLREEVNEAKVVIGLITPSSLSSAFVMFELGARWGANQFLAPLLAGVKPNELSGPLGLLNALSSSNEAQLHQLLENVSVQLGLALQSVASYARYISPVKQLSEGFLSAAAAKPPEKEEMSYEESVYWKHQNGQREGPYCTVCYDNEHKKIHLSAGATKGTYSCGVCGNSFYT
ncbi:MAG: toll/interleukin-1 receptor domain-containing protein [Candidatus Acidiferrales bacterium]